MIIGTDLYTNDTTNPLVNPGHDWIVHNPDIDAYPLLQGITIKITSTSTLIEHHTPPGKSIPGTDHTTIRTIPGRGTYGWRTIPGTMSKPIRDIIKKATKDLPNGIYEIIGPKFPLTGTANPHLLRQYRAVAHTDPERRLTGWPRNYWGIQQRLSQNPTMLGIMWVHPDDPEKIATLKRTKK